jgi:phage terminase small subunit
MGKVATQDRRKAEPLTREAIIFRLVDAGARVADATMYADLFLEYREAAENIREHGVIVQHPRTRNPIENPYLKRRDIARKHLQAMRMKSADWLWETI